MDNWGDPWADNADSSAKSPSKNTVTSPLPTTFAAAPTILGGFFDDAGWGNEDESFGDWSAATTEHVTQTPSALTELNLTNRPAHSPVDTPWATINGTNGDISREEGDWAAVRLDAHKDEDVVVSESSDASTTVQANEDTESNTAYTSVHPPKDDDSSARTSTSPSEASHTDTVVESPRTSYEEERGVVKAKTTKDEGPAARDIIVDETGAETLRSDGNRQEVEDAVLGDRDTQPEEEGRGSAESVRSVSSDSKEGSSASLYAIDAASRPLAASNTPTARAAFPINSELLAKLFTLSKEAKLLDESPDDPIYSTAARKAWYRLTRKQTMREFNSGNDDDNYIRVTWTNSHIRSEVNKIVGRWAREDRISGTGPGARASFYWDTSAPIDPKPMAAHMRQKSSLHITSPIAPTQERDPALLSTNAPAAFSWSSATTSTDHWQQASPGLRSTSSPIAPIIPAVSQVQKQEGRAVPLDLTSRQSETAKHARNLTVANETPIVANLISPPVTDTSTSAPQPWTGLDLFDNNATHKDTATAAVAPTATNDDEDEWGEMVSSPTVSTPTLTESTSHIDTRSNTLSTSATTPQSVKSANIQDQSPDAMHATPIVRLKSTISPTSALFKANPFVPISVEQGPIGPGILKSSRRAVSNSRKLEDSPPPLPKSDPQPAIASEEPSIKTIPDAFTAWQTTVLDVVEVPPTATPATSVAQESIRPSTPPSLPPSTIASSEQSNVDAWADADFSFFESSTLAPAPQPKQEPSDPFFTFETRARSSSAASSAKTFTRSPPRKVPTPPVQPLTGATSSAQRRKTEEDAVVQGILHGLPDLSYMLR